jgi:hypothetical protein
MGKNVCQINLKFRNILTFLKNFEVCVGYMCVSGASVCRVQVCVGCKCVSGASVCRVQVCVGCKCVSGASVLGCMCVSGASVCWEQVCVGYMCVSDTSVCHGKVCVGDKSSRGHVSLNRLDFCYNKFSAKYKVTYFFPVVLVLLLPGCSLLQLVYL